jgi:hypothetical protein
MSHPSVVDRRVLLDGFAQAHARFVASMGDIEGRSAYFALFEALNWAVSLDELIANTDAAGWAWRDGVAGGDVVRGLRYARNLTHHQWADALRFDVGLLPGPSLFPSPTLFPRAASWRWRDLADLPTAGRPDVRGEATYRRLLAGQPPPATLDELARVFAAVV